ncbi:MAG: adenosylcobinamide-GDP ribazoletransferase [Chloroflexi bacterium]|nr:adenosylcobinamide-GDP ribazoletransferase [Chloroflexota bacterium]
MGFLTSLGFLTIIPVPVRREPAEKVGQSLVYFPLVGLFLGLVLVGLDKLLGLVLPLSLTNALLIVVMVVLTGALHLDGFIDTCDGALVRGSPAERLGIMRDSHVGSFGVVGGSCLILLKYAALVALPGPVRTPALVVMPILSRWAMVYAITAFPYARDAGKGLVFKEQANWLRFTIATIVALVASSLLAGLGGPAMLVALWIGVFGIAAFLKLRLGGLTGDSYGAINELSEVLVLAVLPLLAKLPGMDLTGPWHVFRL